jgi:hypothetical protein
MFQTVTTPENKSGKMNAGFKCIQLCAHGNEKIRARQTVFAHTTPTKFSRITRARASAIATQSSIGETRAK